jgi:hypothetical protein
MIWELVIGLLFGVWDLEFGICFILEFGIWNLELVSSVAFALISFRLHLNAHPT